jgi:hypothetical protein
MRTRSILLASLVALACARATTLLQLSLDDMIQQSSGIVRAQVTGSTSRLRGQNIYTYYHLQILETAKGAPGREIDVAVPGGTMNGVRDMVPGAPALNAGSQYVVFLWTSRSGLTQIIGLSQGLFLAVPEGPSKDGPSKDGPSKDGQGKIRLARPAAADLMLDKNGKAISDQSLALEWSDLRARIHKELGK